MDIDDDKEPQKTVEKPLDLDILSIEELEDRIAALRAEIDVLQAAIEKKKVARGTADSFFKT